MQSKKALTRIGVFLALAMIFSYIEFLLPLPWLIPGVKLGLANILVVIPLYLWGVGPAISISLLRILLVSITFGNLATLFYSLAGAMFSLFIMILVKQIPKISVLGVSILGAVFHNLGQLLLAMWMVRTEGLFYYFPILLLSGAVTGALIGMLSAQMMRHLKFWDKT